MIGIFLVSYISVLSALLIYLSFVAKKNSISFPWEISIIIIGILTPSYSIRSENVSISLLIVLLLITILLNIANIRQLFIIHEAKELLRYMAAGITLGLLLGLFFVITNVTNYIEVNTSLSLVSLVSMSIQGSAAEEILFRGFLLSCLRRFKFHSISANILQSLLFMALHIGRYSNNLIALSLIFLVGIVSGYLTWKSNNLFSAVFMHIVINLVAVGWWVSTN